MGGKNDLRVGSSSQKSTGSIMPLAAQSPIRSCAKMKMSGPLPRGIEAVILSANASYGICTSFSSIAFCLPLKACATCCRASASLPR